MTPFLVAQIHMSQNTKTHWASTQLIQTLWTGTDHPGDATHVPQNVYPHKALQVSRLCAGSGLAVAGG